MRTRDNDESFDRNVKIVSQAACTRLADGNPRNYSEVMKALQLPMGDVRQKVMIEARKRIRDVFGAELNASATDGAYHASQCFVSIIKTPEQVNFENRLKSQREEKSKANPSETFLHILLNACFLNNGILPKTEIDKMAGRFGISDQKANPLFNGLKLQKILDKYCKDDWLRKNDDFYKWGNTAKRTIDPLEMLENYVENFRNDQGNVNDLVKEYKKQIEDIEKYKKTLSTAKGNMIIKWKEDIEKRQSEN